MASTSGTTSVTNPYAALNGSTSTTTKTAAEDQQDRFLTLLVTRQAIGFVAIIGFVALSGMVIRNSIILLDQIRQHLESGKTPYDAVVESAALRFRPIMLSSVTDVLGFVPLIPNPFWRPLAVSFIGGLLLATAIGLLVVPAMYCWWYKVKEPSEP